MGSARQGITRLGSWGQSKLRIGAGVSVCQHVLPAVIREFRESFPTCALTVEPAEGATPLELLRSSAWTWWSAYSRAGTSRWSSGRSSRTNWSSSCIRCTRGRRRGRVDRAAIVNQSYILYHRASSMYRMAQDYFRSEGIVLPQSVEFGSMEAIKELVKAGLGSACWRRGLRGRNWRKARWWRCRWAAASCGGAGASCTGANAA